MDLTGGVKMTSWIRLLLSALFVLTPLVALAQAPNPSANAPASTSGEQLLKAEELDALVAPIALYPDTLLAQVLMASTYPTEVVQAERWVNQNKKLKGDQLKAAVDKQPWDGSVKALAATPEVLEMMSSKLDWTQALGDAVLAQQPDLMDAVQRLRSKAQANNQLTSTKEQKVTVRQEQSKQVIVIEPTEPNTIYVPYYNPAVVYGGWPYPAYPPYYFPPPGYIAGGIVATGLAFGAGYALGRWASGGNYWGGGVNWGGNTINVNRPVNINNINNIGNNWQHNPAHRGGVRYSNTNVQQRFGNTNIGSGNQGRPDFRGSGGNQVLRPGGGPGGADRVGQRPGAGDRVGQRPSAGNLPSSGANRPSSGANRPSAGTRPSTGANRPSAGAGPSTGANRPSAGTRPSTGANRPSAATRPSTGQRPNVGGGGGGGRGNVAAARGGGARAAAGGGGARAGGGGGRGGGRRR